MWKAFSCDSHPGVVWQSFPVIIWGLLLQFSFLLLLVCKIIARGGRQRGGSWLGCHHVQPPKPLWQLCLSWMRKCLCLSFHSFIHLSIHSFIHSIVCVQVCNVHMCYMYVCVNTPVMCPCVDASSQGQVSFSVTPHLLWDSSPTELTRPTFHEFKRSTVFKCPRSSRHVCRFSVAY